MHKNSIIGTPKPTRSVVRQSTVSTNSSPQKSVILHPKNVKRLNIEHAKALSKLSDEEAKKIFGELKSMEQYIMTTFLTLGIEDEHGHLAGAITVHTYPCIAALPAWEWECWIENLYGITDATPRNTLWVHYFACDPKYELLYALPILQYMYRFSKHLEFVILVFPPGVSRADSFTDLGTRILPLDCRNPSKTQSLYRLSRADYMISYKIRRAVEEDNDDLVPMIDLYSKRLCELYGRYYIAEILTRHKDSGRHIVVAEHEGSAVSVMILNEVVNYDLLNDEFELTPFNGLKKKSEEDCIEFEDFSQAEMVQSIGEVTDQVDDLMGTKGMFNESFEDEEDFLVDVDDSAGSDYSLVFTSSDIFAFDEEEEVEEREDAAAAAYSRFSEMKASVTSLEILEEMKKVKAVEVDPRLTYVDMMERLSRSILSTRSRIGKIPQFYGKDNAFTIEVVAAHPDHELSLLHVLEAIFECFPDRDYCVISTPSNCRMEQWMTSFNRVGFRATSNFPNDLFVCHKNSLLGHLECKAVTREHMQEVYTLFSTIPTRAIVLSHFEITLEFENSPYQCFVFLCEGHVIGTAVVSEEFNVDYIQSQYDINNWVPENCFKSGTFGVIESMVISPIFHSAGSFLRHELHRMSDYQVLFYKYKVADKNTFKERPIVSLLHWLQPIMPRKMPEYDLNMLAEEGYNVCDSLLRKDFYALYLSTVSQNSMTRICNNTRIVVVGCSNTAYAFLESLILRQSNLNYKINFNNVTLVCPEGIHTKLPKKIKELFMVQKNFMNERYMDLINLRAFVNLVNGSLTHIDRKEKYIVISDRHMLRYDLLFLMCGEKFQKPLQEYRMPFAENPDNVFIINCPMDGNKAIIKMKELQNGPYFDENIIVYGHFLQAYSCLAGLLEYGIPGNKIVLVEPFPYSMNIDKKRRHNISVFNDPDIYHATMEYIGAQRIQVYSSYYFINWTYCNEDNIVTSIKFESKHKMLEMSCKAIFFFYEKSISPKIYQVINEAGLVFDGRLVVDSNCRTNDEKIYAAGTLTKYSRRYFATNMNHKFFNRVEIGRKLGQQIRNMLAPGFVKRSDPKKVGWNFHLDIRDRLVAKYDEPIMRYCRLPGGLYYLSVVKPGRRIPLETASSLENYVAAETWTLKGFSSSISTNTIGGTITVLTKFPIDVRNIYCLWGKHEKLLNNLQLRFEMVLITDFFEYFKQPWAYAIYHERFDELLNELNNIMTSSVGDGECLITNIIEMYKQRKWQPLTNEQQEDLEEKFPNMLYPKIIEQKILDFIQENLTYLPMYAHPIVVRSILEGFDRSPLFSK